MENLSNEEMLNIMIKLKEGYEEKLDQITNKYNAMMDCLDFNDIKIDELLTCDECKKNVSKWTNIDGTFKNYESCKTCHKIICDECIDDCNVFGTVMCIKCQEFKELIASIK